MRNFARAACGSIVATIMLVGQAWGRPPDPEAVPPDVPPCADVLRCQLGREIALTDRFLRERRYGLPYTLDPRPLDYPLEMLRLNVMSQALGYLNLYRLDRRPEHRREALARVEYMLALGDAAFGNGPRDGMYGYAMLEAFELLGDERYLDAGRRAAQRCAEGRPDELSMNGGLMCALNHAWLARLDGSYESAAIVDGIVERTSAKQFEDGAFPHLPYLEAGRNTNYSAWMANELLMLRDLRPGSELPEFLAVNTIEFLRRRVGPDGDIVYRDSLFDYASDPGGGDTRGWTSELASIALDLAAAGERDEAARVLGKLFATRMRGEALGGYPDKYAHVTAGNAWESGRPSVLRTSLVFWFLTLIRRYDRPCNGAVGPCVLSDDDCTELYRELGMCDPAWPAARSCLAGRLTRCYDASAVRMMSDRLCGYQSACAWLPEGVCWVHCPTYGRALCVGESCRDQCLDPSRGECWYDCDSREECVAMTQPDALHLPPGADRTERDGLPLDAELPADRTARRDDLSLQLVRVGGEGPGAAGVATLRVHHHGSRPALGARVTLSNAKGETLTSRALVLAPRSSVELSLPCGPCDSLVARLDAGAPFGERDTLNNVARSWGAEPAGESETATGTEASAPGSVPIFRSLGALAFTLWNPGEAPVRVSVHDVAGRRVRTLWDGLLPRGERALEWDGRTNAGQRAERGVYFVRLVTPTAQAVTRVVILR